MAVATQTLPARVSLLSVLWNGAGRGQASSWSRPPPSVLPPTPCGVGVNESELRGGVFLFTWHLAGDSRVDCSPDFRPVSEGASLPAGRAPTARTLPLGQGTSATCAVQGAGLMEQMGGLRQPFHRPCRGATSLQRRLPGGTAAVLLRELVLSGGTETLLKGVRVSQPPQEARPSSGCWCLGREPPEGRRGLKQNKTSVKSPKLGSFPGEHCARK